MFFHFRTIIAVVVDIAGKLSPVELERLVYHRP